MALEDLDIRIPAHARKYLEDFYMPGCEHRMEWISFATGGGAKIFFDRMTDSEAVIAAHGMRDLLKRRIKEMKLGVN